ncbi:MAG: hypothetical protein HY22_01795 [[Candidatus Thermochlorobacteriaceae] bacterium GBChlB]|nr:MAG: hypothetical protein HY22_01795 [[Candidatus Thermochlorobacteriaceae] bacterium GBChlB]
MKTVGSLKTLRSVKRMPKTRTAKPKNSSADYLNLYVMTVEKDRLEKELAVLERRRGEVLKQLADVTKEIESVAKLQAARDAVAAKNEKPWKTFNMTY